MQSKLQFYRRNIPVQAIGNHTVFLDNQLNSKLPSFMIMKNSFLQEKLSCFFWINSFLWQWIDFQVTFQLTPARRTLLSTLHLLSTFAYLLLSMRTTEVRVSDRVAEGIFPMSFSARLFPPPRRRYHSWYSGSPLTRKKYFWFPQTFFRSRWRIFGCYVQVHQLVSVNIKRNKIPTDQLFAVWTEGSSSRSLCPKNALHQQCSDLPVDLPIFSRKIQKRFTQCQRFHDVFLFPDGSCFPQEQIVVW